MQKYRLGNDFKFTITANECCNEVDFSEVLDLKVVLQHTQNGKPFEVNHNISDGAVVVIVLSGQVVKTGKYGVFLTYKEPDEGFDSGFKNVQTLAGNVEIVDMCEEISECKEFNID